jgi:hypothetical protein
MTPTGSRLDLIFDHPLDELAEFLTRNLVTLEQLHSYVHRTEINTMAFDHSEASVRSRYRRSSFAR